jgi:uncharacterized protein YjbI with pentapeptide repeats
MFITRPCSVDGCSRSALSGRSVCAGHCEDVLEYEKTIIDMLRNRKCLIDYDISGIRLADFAAAGVEISGCNLSGIRLERVKLEKAAFQLVFSDSSHFTACDFTGSSFQNSILAGSDLRDCTFTGCDILLCNLNGIQCRNVTFDHSNLYASRFIGGRFEKVGMRDCNLIRTRFDREDAGIDFRSSNTNEADFLVAGP